MTIKRYLLFFMLFVMSVFVISLQTITVQLKVQAANVKVIPQVREITSLRTIDSKTFLNPDGTFEKDVYQEPIHYLDNGNWEDINNKLSFDSSSEEYTNQSNQFKIKLPKIASKKFKLSYENYNINWTIENASNISKLSSQINSDSQKYNELYNINQNVSYDNIFNNVNLDYDITGSSLKENIVLNQYISNFSLSYDYDLKGLALTKDADDNLVFVDSSNTVIFSVEKLFMLDANGTISNNVNVTITQTNNKEYTVTVTPDDTWLKDSMRAFPVTIDPSISITGSSKISDKYIIVNSPTTYDNLDLYVGLSSAFQYLSYIQFDIGQLIPTTTITNATLQLHKYSDTCTSTCQINLYGVDTNYGGAMYKYQYINGNHYPTANSGLMDKGRVYDYIKVKNTDLSKYYDLDLTSLAQAWLNTGSTYGTIALQSIGTMGYVDFDSVNYTGGIAPLLTVDYINEQGLQSYWTYSTQANGAGAGFVNDYNGNLTFVHESFNNYTERMSFELQLVYNSLAKGTNIGYGNGWRTNYSSQALYDNSLGSYYIIDGTGNYQYFQSESCSTFGETGSSCALAMDGSGAYYVYNSSTHIFKLKTKDYLEYQYQTGADMNLDLNKITDNTTGQYLTISGTYFGTGNYPISKITDSAGNYLQFTYSPSGNKLLSKIEFYKLNDLGQAKKVEYESFGYIGDDITSIIHYYDYNQDGTFSSESTNSFTYSNSQLETANSTNTNEISFSYTGDKVTVIKESNSTNIIKSSTLEYGLKKTTYTDYEGNKTQYMFDDFGRVFR